MDVTQSVIAFWLDHWWLVFPVGFMILGIVRIVVRGDIERKRLDVIKSYTDRGMDVPDALKRQIF